MLRAIRADDPELGSTKHRLRIDAAEPIPKGTHARLTTQGGRAKYEGAMYVNASSRAMLPGRQNQSWFPGCHVDLVSTKNAEESDETPVPPIYAVHLHPMHHVMDPTEGTAWADLDDACVQQVFSKLDARTLVACQQINRRSRQIAQHDLVWQ